MSSEVGRQAGLPIFGFCPNHGEVAEWLIALVSKTSKLQGFVRSTPTLSAIFRWADTADDHDAGIDHATLTPHVGIR